MKTNIMYFLALVCLCLSVTETFAETPACMGKFQPTNPPIGYMNSIPDLESYQKLIRFSAGMSLVKFTYEWKSTPKNLYFQNTNKYEYHIHFLKSEIPKYKSLTNEAYEELLFSPTAKQILGGALYLNQCYQAAGSEKPGILAFNVYFRDNINVDEIAVAHQALSEKVGIFAPLLTYVFERKSDFFKYMMPLKTKGIRSLPLDSLVAFSNKVKVYNPERTDVTVESYGYLRQLTPSDFKAGKYSSKDILILDEVPLDIGPVSGMITTAPQIPHSHVILRSINQNIPNIYYANVTTHESVTSNLGKLVQLKVTKTTEDGDGTFEIQGESVLGHEQLDKLADTYFKSRVQSLPKLTPDLKQDKFYSWGSSEPSLELSQQYGAKGTNFAILDKALRKAGLNRKAMDGAFLVPFSFYFNHVSQPLTLDLCKKAEAECKEDGIIGVETITKLCNGMLKPGKSPKIQDLFKVTLGDSAATAKLIEDPIRRKLTLAFFKALVEKADLPKKDFSRIQSQLSSQFTPLQRIRFRSSTNAEDLPGLNGAGLYTSKAGCIADQKPSNPPPASPPSSSSACMTSLEKTRILDLISKLEKLDPDDPTRYEEMIRDLKGDLDKKRPVEKAIKGVYASLWNEKAFLFRDYYRIPHFDVYMGLLVHPSFVNEKANGVVFLEEDVQADNGTPIPDQLVADVVVQIQDISITNPEIPEWSAENFTLTQTPQGEILNKNYLTRSNLLPSDQFVLQESEIIDLIKQLRIVVQAMESKRATPEKTIAQYDVEFKLSENNEILIKQVRPLGSPKDLED